MYVRAPRCSVRSQWILPALRLAVTTAPQVTQSVRCSMKFISLFAGIGGFDLGFERAGMTCAAQVEIDPFCQKVLAKHWPNVPRFGDIRHVGKHNLPKTDVICGGFPCQPHSLAGKRKGSSDDRETKPCERVKRKAAQHGVQRIGLRRPLRFGATRQPLTQCRWADASLPEYRKSPSHDGDLFLQSDTLRTAYSLQREKEHTAVKNLLPLSPSQIEFQRVRQKRFIPTDKPCRLIPAILNTRHWIRYRHLQEIRHQHRSPSALWEVVDGATSACRCSKIPVIRNDLFNTG